MKNNKTQIQKEQKNIKNSTPSFPPSTLDIFVIQWN